ncbi:hypothetical protein H1C71_042204 [Ictidomys tridecemlineatus]|nr:hypothetical protein H1C71_042204 [Ictidomys tridecemlineatus]
MRPWVILCPAGDRERTCPPSTRDGHRPQEGDTGPCCGPRRKRGKGPSRHCPSQPLGGAPLPKLVWRQVLGQLLRLASTLRSSCLSLPSRCHDKDLSVFFRLTRFEHRRPALLHAKASRPWSPGEWPCSPLDTRTSQMMMSLAPSSPLTVCVSHVTSAAVGRVARADGWLMIKRPASVFQKDHGGRSRGQGVRGRMLFLVHGFTRGPWGREQDTGRDTATKGCCSHLSSQQLGRLRQEDLHFKGSLSHLARP